MLESVDGCFAVGEEALGLGVDVFDARLICGSELQLGVTYGVGLVDLGIITCEDVIRLIDMKDESVELVMTGRHLPEELIPYADYISRLDIVKGACSEKPSCM